jgi:hypothetical protein
VRRWISIADPGDFIAIPAGLARYFEGIDTDLTTPIGMFDTHKVTSYLSGTTTAAALATSSDVDREPSAPTRSITRDYGRNPG